ncbi:MAG: RNA polymerase II C-terminal domain kinase beta subunit [Caeruleum heppii]|nr:MAG: RNA polymerase II C-terminal domain kinase beta subunit [Caeruleum heppii]
MSPAPLISSNGEASPPVGPDPSVIQVAQPYIFEHQIHACMTALRANEAKEDSIRLQGVTWIDTVRRALQLPVRTFNTAAVYYHKFRLVHADNEYNYVDAAAAALFTACKIEDTLKKSKDILCAAYNIKVPAADQLSPDDPTFEQHAKAIIGLERLMLEASGFDFRNRYPQKMLIKLAKLHGVEAQSAGQTAYNMCLDIYRTFAPLKQTSSTMAVACLELATRLHERDLDQLMQAGNEKKRWSSDREEVMETILDLLDLYTHHRAATVIGPQYSLETFIAIRITLNQEASAHDYPRYTEAPSERRKTNGVKELEPPRTTSQSPSDRQPEGRHDTDQPSTAHTRGRGTDRPRDATVRFMLNAGRAREEKDVVDGYFKVEWEEHEVEVERDKDRDRRSR